MSTEASSSTGQRMFSATVMAGIAYVAVPIAGFIGLEVVERCRATRGQWPMVAVMRVKPVVYMAIEATMTVEPRTGSYE